MNRKFIQLKRRRNAKPFDMIMIFVSNKVRYLFFFVLIYMWYRNGSLRKIAYNAAISAGTSLILNIVIKMVYYKPRPFVNNRVGILTPSKKDSSFPSKHTLLVFAVSTTIYRYKRIFGTIMMILSAITGFSRFWLGHHYPSDIIGSAFIGMITSLLFDKLKQNTLPSNNC